MTEEAQILEQYEENQVLWAKIRGFPWWPAYVNQVHPNKDPSKVQYTVIFFGDNTHSREGPSKLRKFFQWYTSFYTKSKTNRKLKISIMKAEQRLKQNKQNVEIYEELRSEMKTRRITNSRTEQDKQGESSSMKEQLSARKPKRISSKREKSQKSQALEKSEKIEKFQQNQKPEKYEKPPQKIEKPEKPPGKKRGRKPNNYVEPVEAKSEKEEQEQPKEQPIKQQQPKKKKRVIAEKKLESEAVEIILSTPQLKILEKIKSSKENKQQLINILSTISISPHNVKQILDLGISNILLEGEITREVYIILQSMKAALLHKYFPDDLKMKKKHERMIKKKRDILRIKMEEDEKSEKGDDDCENADDNEMEGEKQQEDELTAIRKKTVVKIEKILRKSGIDDSAKSLAMKLQSSFQEKSEMNGEKYVNIAKNHLRKLKDKVQEKESSERIMDYLNQITESVEN